MPPTGQRDLARRLREAGLSRRRSSPPPTDPGAILARVLSAAGSLAAAFAHDLARSPERLPALDRASLARVPRQLSPLPYPAVRSLVERQLGAPLATHFATFDEAPTTVTFHHQDHRTQRLDGTPALVRVRRVEAEDPARKAAPLAAVEALRVEGWWLTVATAAFGERLATQGDLSSSAAALHRLAAIDGMADGTNERPRAATVVAELSTAQILTVALPESIDPADGDLSPEACFRLYRGWLLLAMVEGLLWTGPWAGNVRFLGRDGDGDGDALTAGCPLFLGGGAMTLDREARWNLRDYLAATRRGDADRALGYLLRGATRAPGALSPSNLRDHFRQAVPPVTGRGRTLASLLLLHAHLLGIHGYRPAPALGAWQRSLAGLEHRLGAATVATEGTEAEGDPLADAVDDARILAAAARGRELFAPSALRRTFLQCGPQWLDALERRGETANEASRAPSTAPPPSRDSRAAESWVGFGSLVVLLGLLALLGERFGERLAGLHPALTPALAVLFVALAFYTLWFVSRTS
jgi:hypothetical protein